MNRFVGRKNEVMMDDIKAMISQACRPSCVKATGRLVWCCCGDPNLCYKITTDCDDKCPRLRKSCC